MSNYIVQANAESALLQSLYQFDKSDIYDYEISGNCVNGSKSWVKVSPNIEPATPFAGKNVTFKIPRYDLIERMFVKVNLTAASTTGTNDTSRVGCNYFSSMDLRTHNNTLVSNNPAYSIARMEELPADMAVLYNSLVNPTKTWAAASGSISFLCPFFCPFFEKPSMFLDAGFLEQMELSCTINSLEALGGATVPTGVTHELWICYRAMSNASYAEYQARQYGSKETGPKKLNYLAYNMYAENPVTCTAATAFTIDLRVPNAVSRTHVFVADATTQAGPSAVIKDLSLIFSGRTIMDQIPIQVVKGDESFMGKTSVRYVTLATGAPIYAPTYVKTAPLGTIATIYYGDVNDHTWNSGAISF